MRPEAKVAAASRASTPPALFGMVLFLASELMFFGGLFAAYFTLRSITAEWPPADVELEMGLTIVATVMLTVSSLTLHWAITRLRRGDDGGMRLWIGFTFFLGAAFLVIKFYEFATAGFGISSNAYGSLWFTMLGVHAIHLLVGLALLTVVVARAARGVYAHGDTAGADAVGYYWHFVDVVWLGIFATIYLIR